MDGSAANSEAHACGSVDCESAKIESSTGETTGNGLVCVARTALALDLTGAQQNMVKMRPAALVKTSTALPTSTALS